ncbi:MAG: DMT family transporter [Rubrivivax sp.]|nr:DMT family transporter [Rubrivivax sp.]
MTTSATSRPPAGGRAPPQWASAPVWAAVLAAAAFVSMDATIKGLAPRYGAVQLSFFRFASGAAFALVVWALWRSPMPAAAHWRMHLARSALLLVTLGLYFHALSLLALAQAVAMGYTAPIFIALLAMLLLRERPTRWIWVALVLGLAGVAVAMWPELQQSGRPRLAGLLCAGASAITFAFVMVLTRRQAQHDAIPTFLLLQSLLPTAMLGSAALALLALSTLPAAAPWPLWQPVALSDLPAIAAVGAFATVGLAAITWALRHMEASRLAPVEYTGFLWAALIGYFAFGEVPSLHTAASAVLIALGCLLLLRRGG